MKKLISIDLVFENTETVEIFAPDIYALNITGITKSVRMNHTEFLYEANVCDYIELRLNKDIRYQPWTIPNHNEFTLLLNRLQLNDITSIGLKYEDRTYNEIYYVTWHEDNNHSNINQCVKMETYVDKEYVNVCIDKNSVNV